MRSALCAVQETYYVNGQSNTRTVYTNHSNPGGYSGPYGRDGRTPTSPLYDGDDGANGRVELVVDGTRRGAGLVVYNRRYDLELPEFHLGEEEGPNFDGIYEFGEVAHATGFVFANVGGMPHPEQRVRLVQASTKWVRPLDDELLLPANAPIVAGARRALPGRLRFLINYPPTNHAADFDPIIITDAQSMVGTQLGIEAPGVAPRNTPFQRAYPRVPLSKRTLTARFPLGNANGIIGLRSLAYGETRCGNCLGTVVYRCLTCGYHAPICMGDCVPPFGFPWRDCCVICTRVLLFCHSAIHFDIFNVSTKPLGALSNRRSVCVSFALTPVDGLPAEEVQFAFQGNDVPIYPDQLSGDVGGGERPTLDGSVIPAFCQTFPFVPPKGSDELHAEIKLSTRIPAMTKLHFHAMLCVKELTGTGVWTVAQVCALLLCANYSRWSCDVHSNAMVFISMFCCRVCLRVCLNSTPCRLRGHLVLQRRRMIVCVEPSFDPSPNSRIVLITNTGLEQSVYDAWVHLLNALGLPFEQFSVSRYGHLDPALPALADGIPLARHFAGKTIIVPDTPFDVGTPTRPVYRTPSWLLPGAAVRAHLLSPDYATTGPPRFLFVGGPRQQPFGSMDRIVHLLTPPDHPRIGGCNFGNMDLFDEALEAPHFPGHALVRSWRC